MTDPARPRPVPGPLRSAPHAPHPSPQRQDEAVAESFSGLADRPVAEHVAVYEAEHERLQRELSTIDQL